MKKTDSIILIFSLVLFACSFVYAINLKTLDMAYNFYWSKEDKVIKPQEQALAFNKKLKMDANVSRDLDNIGMVYVSQKKYKTAIKYFKESISIKEKILRTATGEVRRIIWPVNYIPINGGSGEEYKSPFVYYGN
jgi:tetratricopeptide (TPR) repeat protein